MQSRRVGAWIAGSALALGLGGSAASAQAQSNACGGPTDEDCNALEYCRYEPGQCGEPGAQGACELRPEVCTQVYEPVCGCDGVTYPNACVAAQSGIAVKASQACAKSE